MVRWLQGTSEKYHWQVEKQKQPGDEASRHYRWRANAHSLRSSAMAMCYYVVAIVLWCGMLSTHWSAGHTAHSTMYLISGTFHPLHFLGSQSLQISNQLPYDRKLLSAGWRPKSLGTRTGPSTLICMIRLSKPENGRSSIFHCCTESVEPAGDWIKKNTIDIYLLPRTENVSFQPYILLRITHDYVMRPGLTVGVCAIKKTYASARLSWTDNLAC